MDCARKEYMTEYVQLLKSYICSVFRSARTKLSKPTSNQIYYETKQKKFKAGSKNYKRTMFTFYDYTNKFVRTLSKL